MSTTKCIQHTYIYFKRIYVFKTDDDVGVGTVSASVLNVEAMSTVLTAVDRFLDYKPHLLIHYYSKHFKHLINYLLYYGRKLENLHE